MKLPVATLLACALSAEATWRRNINYQSPSHNHPGLGLSLHKINKRNTYVSGSEGAGTTTADMRYFIAPTSSSQLISSTSRTA